AAGQHEYQDVGQVQGERPAAQQAEQRQAQQAGQRAALEGEDEQGQCMEGDDGQLPAGVEGQHQDAQGGELEDGEGGRAQGYQPHGQVQPVAERAQKEGGDAHQDAVAQLVEAAVQSQHRQQHDGREHARATTGHGQQGQAEQQPQVVTEAQGPGGGIEGLAVGAGQPGLQQQQAGQRIVQVAGFLTGADGQ